MKVKKSFLSIALVALVIGVQAQTPAKELVQNIPLSQLERGQSVDAYHCLGSCLHELFEMMASTDTCHGEDSFERR